MQVVLCIVSGLFGVLSLVASISQMLHEKKPFPGIVMSGGSLLLLVSAAICLSSLAWDWLSALAGCVGICAAAMYNGIQRKNFHIQHHIVRIALSVLLVIGFILW